MELCLIPFRPATDARSCLKKLRGNIIVDRVGRVSATPAPATECPCLRGAGGAPPSECARTATGRGGHRTPAAQVRVSPDRSSVDHHGPCSCLSIPPFDSVRSTMLCVFVVIVSLFVGLILCR